MLCGVFLFLVFVNGGFKYHLNILIGVLAERMLRRISYQLIQHVIRFPLPHFRSASSGSIVTMIAAETEQIGGFIGDSIALPAYQGGTLLTILAFMFVQDWKLGLAAVALYPVQAYVIPKLQRKVNQLGKARVRNVRQFSEQLGEAITGIGNIHAHGTAQYELANFSDNMATTYEIRYEIYDKKFFIKFLNNFLGQLTPFFFYAIGGYLVIESSLTLGALVAILGAYKEIAAPWKELLVYYQRLEDARQKYEQLVEQFTPAGMLDERLIDIPKEFPRIDAGKLTASNLSLEDDGSKIVSSASFAIGLNEHVALIGPDGGGRSEIAHLLARQLQPTGGQITVGGNDLTQLPEVVSGRYIAYVDGESYIRAGTIRDNLLYGLLHQPTRSTATEADIVRKKRLKEAAAAGNSTFDIRDDWVDYEALGITDASQITGIVTGALRAVSFEDDVFQIGLRRVIDPSAYPELVAGILAARAHIRQRLGDESDLAELVEIFDKEKFNSNASVAENILFGTPLDQTFNVDGLAGNPFVLEVLGAVGLRDQFPELGRAIAALMVELFRDLPPGHEFFERFSFIDSDSLPEYQRILNNIALNGLDSLNGPDRTLLMELPFKLIPSRHRLGLLTEEIEARILSARKLFADTLPGAMKSAIAFFDVERYNAAISLQDNILFGKIATHKADSVTRIGELLSAVINALSLRDAMLDVGLDFDVGIAGKRLTTAQRQKLAIARCLVKKPQLLIVNEANQGLNAHAQDEMFQGIKSYMQGRGLIWVQGDVNAGRTFDRTIRMERGRAFEVAGEAGAGQLPTPPVQEERETAGVGMAALTLQTDVLSGIPFFSGMDRSQLKLLAFASEQHDFSPGEDIIRQGDAGDSAYVILGGSVDVIVDTSHGPTTVATVSRGALMGELALLCDTPRTATVRAKDQVLAMKITKELFFELIQENAAVALNLTRVIADRLAKTMRGISNS